MYWTRLACALLIFFLLTLTLCPVPVGHGPFSATYGPATRFQALQSVLLLLSLVAAAVAARAAADLTGPSIIFHPIFPGVLFRLSIDRSALNSILRC
jgi:hypothetical protein